MEAKCEIRHEPIRIKKRKIEAEIVRSKKMALEQVAGTGAGELNIHPEMIQGGNQLQEWGIIDNAVNFRPTGIFRKKRRRHASATHRIPTWQRELNRVAIANASDLTPTRNGHSLSHSAIT